MNLKKNLIKTFVIYLGINLTFFSNTSHSLNTDSGSLMSMSISNLLNIDVVTASKKKEKSFNTSSAVYVITGEDIKRSGATSIPEALRLAPGVNVARISSNKWAISIRGFNRQFSNKLLVLFDGRSIYNNLFSGVYWDEQDYVLDDIERIEIVRGSGGSLWGVNAVNGIINIITKSAKDTTGGYVSLTSGNHDKFIGEIRQGGKIKKSHYRVYAKSVERDDTHNLSTGNGTGDDWYMHRAGFRYDTDQKKQNIYTIQGDYYDGNQNQTLALPKDCGSFCTVENIGDEQIQGGNLLVKLDREYNEESSFNLATYFSHDNRQTNVLEQDRLTYDVDLQYSFKPSYRNRTLVGAEYKNERGELDGKAVDGVTYLNYTPNNLTYETISAFIQNKTELTKKMFLILGSKFSHNDFTHFEFQPTAKFSYFPKSNHHLWLSTSKAVRTPTRGERGLSLIVAHSGAYITQDGDSNYDAEEVISYEAGYKYNFADKFSFDIASFYNDYSNMRSFYLNGASYDILNNGEGESYGFEVSTIFDVTKNWRLSSSYSFLRVDTRVGDPSLTYLGDHINNEGISPRNQVNFRSSVNLSKKLHLDNMFYFYDNLNPQSSSKSVDAYVKFDSRIGYQISNNFEVSLIGQNLFDSRHQEFSNSLYAPKTEIGRYVALQLSSKF